MEKRYYHIGDQKDLKTTMTSANDFFNHQNHLPGYYAALHWILTSNHIAQAGSLVVPPCCSTKGHPSSRLDPSINCLR